jgi:biopolymer transport protein ExbD
MRRNKRHVAGDVQLNMAAMLDMAFQLLAFFILTYSPGKVEGCISIRMPPASPITRPDSSGGAQNPNDATAVAGAVSLQISLTANKEGGLATIRIGEHAPVTDLRDLEEKLRSIAKVSESPFDQVLLKVSRNLEYENVLKVIEICARNKLTSGDQQTKVSIVEMP